MPKKYTQSTVNHGVSWCMLCVDCHHMHWKLLDSLSEYQEQLSVLASPAVFPLKTVCQTIQDCLSDYPRLYVIQSKGVCQRIQDCPSDNPRQSFRSSKTVCKIIQDSLSEQSMTV